MADRRCISAGNACARRQQCTASIPFLDARIPIAPRPRNASIDVGRRSGRDAVVFAVGEGVWRGRTRRVEAAREVVASNGTRGGVWVAKADMMRFDALRQSETTDASIGLELETTVDWDAESDVGSVGREDVRSVGCWSVVSAHQVCACCPLEDAALTWK
eukprot:3941961-Rhodomonas_salina.13